MKKTFPIVLAGVFLLSVLMMPRADAQDEARSDARVRDLEAQVQALVLENELTHQRLEEVVGYLNERAKDGQAMLQRVEEAEQMGFIPGINYPSREALIAGWRTYYGRSFERLPQPAKAADGDEAKRARR